MVVTYELSEALCDPATHDCLLELSQLIIRSKRIVVVIGAGVSSSSGIPDFRSPGGLYNHVCGDNSSSLKGKDIFDASVLRRAESAAQFYSFIARLKVLIDNADPTRTHSFVQWLLNKRTLLRAYTQNIDGIEARIGLTCDPLVDGGMRITSKRTQVVQLHGDIHYMRCVYCSAIYPCSQDFVETLDRGRAPDCPECAARCADRVARCARAVHVGCLRPAIVLNNEVHPGAEEIGEYCAADIARRPDLLLILGTSLRTHGLKGIVKDFARALHASKEDLAGHRVVYVNKTAPPAEMKGVIDVYVSGVIDDWVERVMDEWTRHN
ncbi:DHS-like NAD/FAD-binding domain-containing protein [Auricularia subglabra TFB-10046 SS5]|nr:DHS-like NAD/FAD-binding domain-containing protein [Auricularia subglabra TFB-10046 SS5]